MAEGATASQRHSTSQKHLFFESSTRKLNHLPTQLKFPDYPSIEQDNLHTVSTLSLEGRLFGGPGPQTVLFYSTCGEDGPHNILSLSFVCLLLLSGDMGPDIRQCGELGPTLSPENNSCFLMADKN